eukprot:GHVH01005988.1.p1 GENE.GHVH01005988.1~~GHVH01005988.1.p1  ORF type:complete len:775 (-),score=71.79 GHVH01005988.1:82-2406(-)
MTTPFGMQQVLRTGGLDKIVGGRGRQQSPLLSTAHASSGSLLLSPLVPSKPYLGGYAQNESVRAATSQVRFHNSIIHAGTPVLSRPRVPSPKTTTVDGSYRQAFDAQMHGRSPLTYRSFQSTHPAPTAPTYHPTRNLSTLFESPTAHQLSTPCSTPRFMTTSYTEPPVHRAHHYPFNQPPISPPSYLPSYSPPIIDRPMNSCVRTEIHDPCPPGRGLRRIISHPTPPPCMKNRITWCTAVVQILPKQKRSSLPNGIDDDDSSIAERLTVTEVPEGLRESLNDIISRDRPSSSQAAYTEDSDVYCDSSSTSAQELQSGGVVPMLNLPPRYSVTANVLGNKKLVGGDSIGFTPRLQSRACVEIDSCESHRSILDSARKSMNEALLLAPVQSRPPHMQHLSKKLWCGSAYDSLLSQIFDSISSVIFGSLCTDTKVDVKGSLHVNSNGNVSIRFSYSEFENGVPVTRCLQGKLYLMLSPSGEKLNRLDIRFWESTTVTICLKDAHILGLEGSNETLSLVVELEGYRTTVAASNYPEKQLSMILRRTPVNFWSAQFIPSSVEDHNHNVRFVGCGDEGVHVCKSPDCLGCIVRLDHTSITVATSEIRDPIQIFIGTRLTSRLAEGKGIDILVASEPISSSLPSPHYHSTTTSSSVNTPLPSSMEVQQFQLVTGDTPRLMTERNHYHNMTLPTPRYKRGCDLKVLETSSFELRTSTSSSIAAPPALAIPISSEELPGSYQESYPVEERSVGCVDTDSEYDEVDIIPETSSSNESSRLSIET